ncbi:hypothetical protein AARAC_001593 [Aspergillus arachidicola]|uniref:Rhodopsin domain-containing protein n=1 Tax=Aspergillus arachidicola TaxID=656916 RepID=A0A2G7G5I7_9EURO|nr:hypothetical protein AARAC_001593 [Aspergillus arachidicola]
MVSIQPGSQQDLQIGSYVTFGVAMIMIGMRCVACFICEPISVIWKPEFPEGCLDMMSFNYFNGAFHVTTDILLALLPIPIVKKLQTNNRRKSESEQVAETNEQEY